MAEPPRAPAPALRIEVATETDAAALAVLASEAQVPGWSAASLASTLRDVGALALLVRDATGAPLGFSLLRGAAGEIEVLLVVVAPALRRRGIGRALLAKALARVPGASVAHLEVRASNAAAIALYESLGFVAVGRRPRYYEGGEDALSMRCKLAGSIR